MSLNTTLDDLESRIAAVSDQDEATANISTADYSLRRMYLNMAQREWAETYDWRSLYQEYNARISTSTGNASVALPANFRKSAGFPQITYDGVTTLNFHEIRAEERTGQKSSSEYVYFLGDQSTGYTMVINAPTLASGASVFIPYRASVASLVSPTDVAMCPNPEYLVQRSLAYIWESRSDARFPQAKAESDKILQKMLEYEQVYGEGMVDSIQTADEKYYNFRWGR